MGRSNLQESCSPQSDPGGVWESQRSPLHIFPAAALAELAAGAGMQNFLTRESQDNKKVERRMVGTHRVKI